MDFPWLAFDLETTGLDVEADRVVTCALIRLDPPAPPVATTLLVNPGIPIPAAATVVHGITDAIAAEGLEPGCAVQRIADTLRAAAGGGIPIVGMNLSYDLTLLDRECRRHGVAPLDPDSLRIIDAYVLDKHVDQYRRGSRRLEVLAGHYRVALDGAHEAAADALAAARVVWRIVTTHQALGVLTLDELHAAQVGWAAQQAESFRDYLTGLGEHERAATVDGVWPIRPFRATNPVG